MPLTDLLKKSQSYNFDDKCVAAFRRLKSSFLNDAVLAPADVNQQFFLETDASSFAMGAALHQRDPKSQMMRPIGFFSAKWDSAQRNYAIPDKELLAILLSLRHWRHLLQGSAFPVEIKCDHKNLSRFRKHSRLTDRQRRWYLELEDYNFHIDYSAGTNLKVADALSRRPDYSDEVPQDRVLVLPDHRILSVVRRQGKPIRMPESRRSRSTTAPSSTESISNESISSHVSTAADRVESTTAPSSTESISSQTAPSSNESITESSPDAQIAEAVGQSTKDVEPWDLT